MTAIAAPVHRSDETGQDDKHTFWLSQIPEHWISAPLKQLITSIEQGWSPQCYERPSEPGEWGVLKVGCVNGNAFDANENKALPPDLEPVSRLSIKRGDLLVSRANTRDLVGSAAMATQDHPQLLLCDKLFRIRFDETIYDPRYAVLILRSPIGRSSIEGAATGTSSSMLNISQATVRNLVVPVPPLHVQSGIVAYLDNATQHLDELHNKQMRMLDVIAEQRRALISTAVTRGLDAGAALAPSGVPWIGDVPAHWTVIPLRKLATVRTGVTKGRDLKGVETLQVPYLRVANVQDGYLNLDDVSMIEIAAPELERFRLQPGDVLMNEGGDNDKLGRGAVWSGQIDPCVHQNHVFSVRPHAVEPEWLALVNSSSYAKHYFQLNANQSTNLASIASSSLRSMPVVLPPPAERAAILAHVARELTDLDRLAGKIRQQLTLAREYRAALITAAVTGQIDVRTAHQDAPA
ncbi:hypothetical protein [Deinococcus yunweiensis]|uniref:restriction endonuclease subunit S n=1 Tax=Deinococcus yunweiensis TaxID=367282 RepID=UPI00398F49CD